MFDWINFLNSHNIEYTHNQSRRELELQCPFCGEADPSQHMGISTRGNGWHCWRDELHHSGKSNARLIVALIGCSFDQAKVIEKQEYIGGIYTDETFTQEALRRLGMSAKTPYSPVKITPLKLLSEFRPLQTEGLCGRLIIPYLVNKRKYRSAKEVMELADRFGLMYALTGIFAYRVIIPVTVNGEPVTWTARTVTDSPLRYLSLSDDPEVAAKQRLPQATRNIKDCLFDYDNLRKGGDILVVCEGPFDAMRITYLGERYGIVGTCLFNSSIRISQIDLLMTVLQRFNKVVLLLDRQGTQRQILEFPEYVKVEPLRLPVHIADPAELEYDDFILLFELY